jgi:hypothetical protein
MGNSSSQVDKPKNSISGFFRSITDSIKNATQTLENVGKIATFTISESGINFNKINFYLPFDHLDVPFHQYVEQNNNILHLTTSEYEYLLIAIPRLNPLYVKCAPVTNQSC